jgi:AraC family transcriptional regulator
MKIQTLENGSFFGHAADPVAAGDFTFSCMRPTVPPEEMQLHQHHGAHFVLVLSGAYSSTAYGSEQVSRGPALIFNPPGTEHRDCFLEMDGSFMTISLSAERFGGLVEQKPVEHPLRLERAEQLQHALAIFRAVAFSGINSLHAEALAVELLDMSAAGASPLQRRREHSPPWLRTAREAIQDRCRERLGLRELASEIGVHPVHLTRAFRRFVRQTPGAYHQRCRLEKAAVLLSAGTRCLADISAETGFADQSHFSRSFHKFYGLPPGQFRSALPKQL